MIDLEGNIIIFDPCGDQIPELFAGILECPIDIQNGEYLQQESQACSKIIVINFVCDNAYEDEILSIINSANGNFKELKYSKNRMLFFELMNSTMKDKNFVLSMLFQATKINLLVQTSKKRSFFY